jgi:ubiquinone biosynthesis protein COQ4
MLWSAYAGGVPGSIVWIGEGISSAFFVLAAAAAVVLVALAARRAARSQAAAGGGLAIAPPPPPRPLDWRWGLRSLRQLLDDPESTEKAFEVFAALDGASEERTFQRFLAEPRGPRLAAERPSLVERLTDREGLGALPPGSFGRAYLSYLEQNRFAAGGLLALKDALEAKLRAGRDDLPRLDPLREWFRDRTILMHDLWHVLTGYGTDEMGEAALLAFTLGQLGGRANTLLVFGIAARSLSERRLGFLRYLFRAWRRGRRSGWLNGLPYEELLPLPLDVVRRTARLEPAAIAHPGGILHGRFAPRAVPG